MTRITTERKNEAQVRAILDKYLEAYTTYIALGRWRGQNEPSLVIDIEDTGGLGDEQLREMAREIKEANQQEAVLVQKIETEYQLV